MVIDDKLSYSKETIYADKKGPHGPQKLSSLKTLLIKKNIPHGYFHSCNHKKWLPYQILGGKTVKNVQIDLQTMKIWIKHLNTTLSIRECVSERVRESVIDTLVREKLSSNNLDIQKAFNCSFISAMIIKVKCMHEINHMYRNLVIW